MEVQNISGPLGLGNSKKDQETSHGGYLSDFDAVTAPRPVFEIYR